MTQNSSPQQSEVIVPRKAAYHVSDKPYDETIAQKALQFLQKEMGGNGLNPQKLTLEHIEGENVCFYAMLRLKLTSTITRKERTGQTIDGERISSGSLNVKIDQLFEEIKYRDHYADHIKQDLKTRPHGGFGLKNHDIPMPISKSFIEQEQCGQCRGQGAAACAKCHGQTQMPCHACSGSRFAPCVMCRGTGHPQTAGSQQNLCAYCQGRGQTQCTQCRGAGHMPCTLCAATGRTQCKPCASTGIISHASQVDIGLSPNFEIMQRGFPKHVAALAQHSPEKLCDLKLISIEQISEEEIDHHIKEGLIAAPERDDYLYIAFKAICPTAKLRLSLAGKKTINAEIAGYDAAFQHCDNLMDLLLKKPFMLLRSGAKTPALAATNLKKACQWRSIKTILAASVQNTPAKVLPQLKKQIPVGLSDKLAKALCINAYKCIKNITRLPRYIALAGCTLASSIIYKFWFDSLKTEALDKFNILESLPLIKDIALDSAVYLLTTVIAVIIVKLAGYVSIKSLYRDLGLDHARPPWPRAGKLIPYTMMLQLAVFIGVGLLWATQKPEWFSILPL